MEFYFRLPPKSRNSGKTLERARKKTFENFWTEINMEKNSGKTLGWKRICPTQGFYRIPFHWTNRTNSKFGDRKKALLLARANACGSIQELRDWALKEKIWRVSLRNRRSAGGCSEDGWSGYIAYDQIKRNTSTGADINNPVDVSQLLVSMMDLIRFNRRWASFLFTGNHRSSPLSGFRPS